MPSTLVGWSDQPDMEVKNDWGWPSARDVEQGERDIYDSSMSWSRDDNLDIYDSTEAASLFDPKGQRIFNWRRTLTDHEEECIKRIVQAIRLDACPIAFGGRIVIPLASPASQAAIVHPTLLNFSLDELTSVQFLRAGDNEAAEAAFKVAKPSSHGQGGNTVYDETVRLAREIPATDIYLSTIVSDAIVRITDIVTRTLGLTSISVKMDKLSLYGPGGFFSTHKDTPKGPAHIGTLLVALPTVYSGGELIVRDAEQEHRFDWSSLNPDELGWAFLYADKDHEILPVQSGYRAVLQLQFDAENSASDKRTRAPFAEHDSRFYDVIIDLLKDSTFIPEGAPLVIGLQHLYALPKMSPRFSDSSPTAWEHTDEARKAHREGDTETTQLYLASNLKGDDKLIHAVLSMVNCAPTLATAFDHDRLGSLYCGEPYDMKEGAPKDNRSSHVKPDWTSESRCFQHDRFRFVSRDLRIAVDMQTEEQPYSGCFENCNDLPESFGIVLDPDMISDIGIPHLVVANRLHSLYASGAGLPETIKGFSQSKAFGTYGNDANLEFVYVTLVLVAKVPAYADRTFNLSKVNLV